MLIVLKDYLREHNIPLPRFIITDRAQACINALGWKLPSVPFLICRWHMNRNVLGKARLVLGLVPVANAAPRQDQYENTWQTESFMMSYYEAVDSETEQEFEEHCSTLRSKSEELANDLDRHWRKYKTHIVRCWTKHYPHFGYQATSAVKGTHAKCKRWIQSSRGDLYTVFQNLLPLWVSVTRALRLLAERNATITPYRLQAPRYSRVVRIITISALNATDKLWKEALAIIHKRHARTVCSGLFRRCHGRPCLHELITIIESNGQLKLKPTDFDKHWWVRRDDPVILTQRLEEPAVIPRSHCTPLAQLRNNISCSDSYLGFHFFVSNNKYLKLKRSVCSSQRYYK